MIVTTGGKLLALAIRKFACDGVPDSQGEMKCLVGDGCGSAPDPDLVGYFAFGADFPVERIYRDVRVCQIHEGAPDIRRLVIGRAGAADSLN